MMAVLVAPQQQWRVRVFLDGGSEASYITQCVADSVGLAKVGEKNFRHQLFGGSVTENKSHPRYRITLKSLDGRATHSFVVNGIKQIAQKIRKPQYGSWVGDLAKEGIYFHNQRDASDEVQLLLGMDVMAQIMTGGFRRINNSLMANATLFGWVIGGHEKGSIDDITTANMVTTMMVSEQTVENLWSLEAMGIKEDANSESKEDFEKATSKFFEDSIRRQPDGRYVVSLPWKEGHKKLTSNFPSCLARLKKTTYDLKRDNYWEAYNKIFENWETENIIEEVTLKDETELLNMYLLPHRHIIKSTSNSTPVRPVFDATAKGKGGPSLNDCLANGPNLLEHIPNIMSRFRKEKYGAVSDIKAAFLQIELAKSDQMFLQFLWWKDSTCSQLKLYRHRRVVFGVKPSPFLLEATLNYHIRNALELDDNFKDKLLEGMYVDNSCSSHHTMEQAKDFMKKSQELLLPAKFDLRGWEFSSSTETKTVGVLGMLWETKEDVLLLNLESVFKKVEGPHTKRHLLSIVNSLFDPMGFVSAFSLIPKLLLQECCRLKLSWDAELPADIVERLTKWKSQVVILEKFKIPRWLGFSRENISVTLHCFCDASGFAYGTTIFVRMETGSVVTVQMVMAKSRVAPLKTKMTIPRLELLACGLGARLTNMYVRKYLELEDTPTYFWSDSMTALTWIRNEKGWARFVSNRVDAIRKITKKEEWNFVPGEHNPADIFSRGCTATYLVEKRLWEGPSWLRMSMENWPYKKQEADEQLVNEERKKTVAACFGGKNESFLDRITVFSDYHKMIRVIATVLKFVSKLKRKSEKKSNGIKNKVVPALSATEIESGENVLLKLVQRDAFTGVDDKRIAGMGAFLDENGLIRIKSQLLFGNDDFGLRCPIALPHHHPVVKSLIYKEHSLHSHAGTQILQSIIRDRFWILKCRRTISGVVTACPVCKRFLAKRCEVPTPQLPMNRIRTMVAFDVTGVDLAGPLYLRGGKKCWVVLFTCGVYRAIHLEMVTALSTQAFLNAFRRFTDRRGRPSHVYSDNGLNFVGCANLFKEIDWNAVQQYSAVKRIDWHFNPPTAAWWGGWWERLIGLVKQLMRRILGRKSVDYDELHTILCDVESTLNRRPLTYQAEGDELLPLCPGYFIKDNPNNHLPEADVVDGSSLRGNLRICQKLREELRGRFRKEYLGQLQHHAKTVIKTVKPGDVVIVEDDNKRRLDWSLGVVIEVYPGRDGLVRTARVKTRDGVFLRAVQRLFMMEVAEKMSDVVEETVKEAETVDAGENVTVDTSDPVSRYGRKLIKPHRLRY